MSNQDEFSWYTNADGANSDGTVVLSLRGPLVLATAAQFDRDLDGLDGPINHIDLAGITEIDTVGAWLVFRLEREFDAQIIGASEEATRLIDAVSASKSQLRITPSHAPLWQRIPALIGRFVVGLMAGSIGMLGFIGALLLAIWATIRAPRRFRIRAFVRQVELVGIDSLGIIALMSFLIGIVIAQQGAAQLQQFGAEIYTVNLTGRLALRELGTLMTAIMIAGRSGSAFAAQIGTMKLTEEIDAMRTIGVSPMEALVLPRVLASMLMMTLVGFLASLMAIVGGAFISSFVLDIPFATFLARVQEVVPIRDLYVGLIKGPVFGLIVALTGCYQGMQVAGNSEDVGLRTTRAVVQAIFMVIVLDSFFAVFFYEIGWL